ncbi:hypothetical protein EPN42_08520 [bacterium]|nr:MAG: hypothetical protein EPN42_08520 [bacterium]
MGRPTARTETQIAANMNEIARTQGYHAATAAARRLLHDAQTELAEAERDEQEAQRITHAARETAAIAERVLLRVVMTQERAIRGLQADNAALCAGARREQVA